MATRMWKHEESHRVFIALLHQNKVAGLIKTKGETFLSGSDQEHYKMPQKVRAYLCKRQAQLRKDLKNKSQKSEKEAARLEKG